MATQSTDEPHRPNIAGVEGENSKRSGPNRFRSHNETLTKESGQVEDAHLPPPQISPVIHSSSRSQSASPYSTTTWKDRKTRSKNTPSRPGAFHEDGKSGPGGKFLKKTQAAMRGLGNNTVQAASASKTSSVKTQSCPGAVHEDGKSNQGGKYRNKAGAAMRGLGNKKGRQSQSTNDGKTPRMNTHSCPGIVHKDGNSVLGGIYRNKTQAAMRGLTNKDPHACAREETKTVKKAAGDHQGMQDPPNIRTVASAKKPGVVHEVGKGRELYRDKYQRAEMQKNDMPKDKDMKNEEGGNEGQAKMLENVRFNDEEEKMEGGEDSDLQKGMVGAVRVPGIGSTTPEDNNVDAGNTEPEKERGGRHGLDAFLVEDESHFNDDALHVAGLPISNSFDERKSPLKELVYTRFCLCLLLALIVGIAVGVSVPLAMQDSESEKPSTSVPTVSSSPTNFPSSSPTSTPTLPSPTSTPTLSPTKQFSEFKLTASDKNFGDRFGYSVAASGVTLVIGAFKDSDNGKDSGSAYIFVLNGTSWTEQAKLTAPDGAALFFGRSVALSGDTAVIGATDFVSSSAHVYIRNGTSWIQQETLVASDGEPSDSFGYSVAVSGETAVVGAFECNDNGSRTGCAYVYVRDGTRWLEQAKLTPSDGVAGDRFGRDVAVSENTIVVGTSNPGKAYVFIQNGTNWVEQTTIDAASHLTRNSSKAFDAVAVAVSGDTIVLGTSDDDGRASESGCASVYVRNGTTWKKQSKLIASDGASGDGFGLSVAVEEDTIVVGAYADDDITGSSYVYFRNVTTWMEQSKLTASDAAERDWFGSSVAVSGNIVVVGAVWERSGTGSAYVYFHSN